jgi:hypothetical protein
MAEKGNLSNTRLKRAIDMRWCVDYLILGGVSVPLMRAGRRTIRLTNILAANICCYKWHMIPTQHDQPERCKAEADGNLGRTNNHESGRTTCFTA